MCSYIWLPHTLSVTGQDSRSNPRPLNRDTHWDAWETSLVPTQKALRKCAPSSPIWKHFPQAKA